MSLVEELIDFIRFSLKEGISLPEIEDSLREAGHSHQEIADALSQALDPARVSTLPPDVILQDMPLETSGEEGKGPISSEVNPTVISEIRREEFPEICPEICIDDFKTQATQNATLQDPGQTKRRWLVAPKVELEAVPQALGRPSLQGYRKDERIRYLLARVKKKRAEKRRRKTLLRLRITSILVLAILTFLLYRWLYQ